MCPGELLPGGDYNVRSLGHSRAIVNVPDARGNRALNNTARSKGQYRNCNIGSMTAPRGPYYALKVGGPGIVNLQCGKNPCLVLS